MLKVQWTRYTQLLLAGLLMMMLAVSIMGTAVQSQTSSFATDATAVIACNGGSDGACGG